MTKNPSEGVRDPVLGRDLDAHVADEAVVDALGRLSRLGAALLDAPVALIALAEAGDLTFKTCAGPPELRVDSWDAPSTRIFCKHVIATGEPLLIGNTGGGGPESGRTGGRIVAYAGVPLRTRAGSTVGALCVADSVARQWTDQELATLSDLADAVVAEIELRIEVAERRRVETALRESEARFRTLVETSYEGIWTIDHENRTTYVNRQMAEMLGYTVDEMVGRRLFDFMDGEARAAAARSVERRRAGIKEMHEFRFRHRSGAVVWTLVSARPTFGNRGEYQGTLAMVTDITERKQAEEEQKRLSAIIEATTDLVAIADAAGGILYLNRSGRRMLGIADDRDLSGTELSGLYPVWAYDVTIRERIPTAIRDGVWTGEAVLLDRRRREIPVSQVIVAHKSETGTLEFLSTIARDLTAHKRLEAQLWQSQRLEAIGRLAGGVAHDFNNLLTAIKGHADLILDELPPTDPLRVDLDEIRYSAERATLLTRQLLAFGRRQVLQPRILDLNAVIMELEPRLRRRVGDEVELVTALEPELGRTKADPDQIEEVILNLAANAGDATARGGRVTIATANATLDEEFSRRFPYRVQPGAYVLLSVRDTGTGMDPQTQVRIFEPFYTTKEQGKGTGLGLSTVYGIVKQSDGYIWVESEVGRGSTFRIYLPRVDGTISASHSNGIAGVGRSAEHETVLLVEDEDSVRSLTRRILERRGYAVLEARHGIEALQVSMRYPGTIHLLLTDLTMPEMSGRELAERFTSLRPDARVLYMSGYTADDVFRRGVLESGVPFLEKPFTPEALGRKVRELLGSGAS